MKYISYLTFFFLLHAMAAEPVITPVDRQVEILAPGQDFVWQVKDDSAVAGTIATWQTQAGTTSNSRSPFLLSSTTAKPKSDTPP